jgi:DNA-binding NtrC family response regulator
MYVETATREIRSSASPLDATAVAPGLKTLMADYERRLILEALNASGWHQRRAAAHLRVLPTTLLEKMKRLGIRRARAVEALPSSPLVRG